jgi:ATP-dependent helicase/nuclease subunit B
MRWWQGWCRVTARRLRPCPADAAGALEPRRAHAVEAFIRHAGESGEGGLLMPRMIAVGDLDLDEKLGAALDPLGAADIPPACDPMRRWLTLDRLIAEERAAEGMDPLPGRARLNLAREMARTMDRLLVEEKARRSAGANRCSIASQSGEPLEARDPPVRAGQCPLAGGTGGARGGRCRDPPQPAVRPRCTALEETPAAASDCRCRGDQRRARAGAAAAGGGRIAAGRGGAARPRSGDGRCRLGRTGPCGRSDEPGGAVFGADDALSHPQYHLKLLLNRMGVNRAEVQPWHRRGHRRCRAGAGRAISSLFLPPQASRSGQVSPPDRRRLAACGC